MKKVFLFFTLLFAFFLSTQHPAHAYRDLETGTFLTRDPAGFVDGPNLYSYVRQNPWSYFDPHGLERGYAGYWNEVGEMWSGYGQALKGTAVGLYNVVRHPVNTATGIYSAATNPKRTWNTVKTGVRNAADAIADGDNEVAGQVVMGFLESAIPASKVKFLSKADELGDLGKLRRGSTPEKSAKVTKTTQCFALGTPVATPQGWKRIEELEEGKIVYALDETTGERTKQRVTAVLRNQTYWWVDVKVAGETITSTRTHRFWVMEENGWKQAKHLRAGEHLRCLDGTLVEIESVVLWDGATLAPTFNLEVENDHVYYVGNVGVLVHNGDVDPLPAEKLPPKTYANGLTSVDPHIDHGIPQATNLPGVESKANLRSRPASENLAKSFYDKETVRYVEALRAAGKSDAWIADHLKTEYAWASNSAFGEKVTPQQMRELLDDIPDPSTLCPRH